MRVFYKGACGSGVWICHTIYDLTGHVENYCPGPPCRYRGIKVQCNDGRPDSIVAENRPDEEILWKVLAVLDGTGDPGEEFEVD